MTVTMFIEQLELTKERGRIHLQRVYPGGNYQFGYAVLEVPLEHINTAYNLGDKFTLTLTPYADWKEQETSDDTITQ